MNVLQVMTAIRRMTLFKTITGVNHFLEGFFLERKQGKLYKQMNLYLSIRWININL